jgi:pyruvate formate lyase activating enzyme
MDQLDRREFIRYSLCATAAMFMPAFLSTPALGAVPHLQEAMFYEALPDKKVHCTLCPCDPQLKGYLADGQTCVCRVRVNKGGKLYITNYAQPTVIHQDPVEKNPLYHLHPGTMALALATAGCNLSCDCCQNWEISQVGTEKAKVIPLKPSEVVDLARKYKCGAVSYSYTEPIIYYEYMAAIAPLARKAGLLNCMLTGGYVNPEPLKKLLPLIDGFSISVKGFSEAFYVQRCRGSFEVLKRTLKIIREGGKWLELSVLPIPTLSDNMGDIENFCLWVRKELGEMTPVHFLRFKPMYRLNNIPQAPVILLETAYATARKAGLKYVYIENLPGHRANNTYCHSCGQLLVQRVGFKVFKNELDRGGHCPKCRKAVPGEWGV